MPESDPLYVAYHDGEWGVPSRDDRHLFELLVLEGAQAGLSWATILRKREGYRRAFAGFDADAVAGFGPADVERLLGDAGIVRNRLKIESAVANARATLAVREEHGSFAAYLWGFVADTPIQGRWRTVAENPAETAESRVLSRELKSRGFRFVGRDLPRPKRCEHRATRRVAGRTGPAPTARATRSRGSAAPPRAGSSEGRGAPGR